MYFPVLLWSPVTFASFWGYGEVLHPGRRQHFSHNSISQVTQASGFEVLRVYRIGFPFFNLYRLTVIARGANLIEDVRTGSNGSPGKFALV
jgi:hypothetical protein